MNQRRRMASMLVLHTVGIVTLATAAGLASAEGLIALPLMLAVVIIVIGWSLHRRLSASTRALDEFLTAATHADVGRRFSGFHDQIDAELSAGFDAVLARLAHERRSAASTANRLDMLVRHVPIPLVVVTHDGTIRYANQALRRFVEINGLDHLDQLERIAPGLPRLINRVPAGGAQITTVTLRDRPIELRISASETRVEGTIERIVTLENLTPALADREASAWRDLTRVLSHEIMNSLTPVTSLADSANSLLDDPAHRDDVATALETIKRRSAGLMDFVASYREVTRLPRPTRTRVLIDELFEHVCRLVGSDAITPSVQPPTLTIDADRSLVEQVLINLVKNSLEAGARQVHLCAGLERGRTVIEIEDDGDAIDPATAKEMFVPFFTTKTNGSGIGLTIAKQIMTAHGGTISHVQPSHGGTRFVLVF